MARRAESCIPSSLEKRKQASPPLPQAPLKSQATMFKDLNKGNGLSFEKDCRQLLGVFFDVLFTF